ncbi:MAG: SDR family oxidoreductase [Pirellulales bacterium]|nr:SDR family oxidoreductase [Pirellulales bacterium]
MRGWSTGEDTLYLMEWNRKMILLTGATGYVGGRLLTLLEKSNRHVRCLTRRPAALSERVNDTISVVEGDVFDPGSLERAFEGIDIAYYLVHSMGDHGDFESQDRIAAQNFAQAAAKAGVKRIIYLGGLGNPDEHLSKHLRSRQETGDILRAHHAHVIEFRASIVIGSGSLSFEMIRSLVERLPIMICPRWVRVKAQPIAIEDLLAYLIAALDIPDSASQIFEIGGPQQVSYGDIMHEYARQRGLTRWMIPVPFLTPYLSSLWLGLVTPLYARVGRKLVESLRNPTLVSNNLAESVFAIRPRPVRDAIARALVNEDQEFAETRWSDALSAAGNPQSWGGNRYGSRLVDSRTITVSVPPAQAFTPIRRIGGATGWYYGNWLWNLRGFLDLLCGGVGVRRGRRDPENLHVGEALDFWRVEIFEPNKRLRLQAEMKMPGRGWLEFEVTPGSDGSTIRQTAIFDPLGLAGLLYWYGIYPLHLFVFAGMLRNLARAAENLPQQAEVADPIRPNGIKPAVKM